MATVAQQQAMFTGCGVCGAELCGHGVCRVCGTCETCDPQPKPAGKTSALNQREQQRLHELADERRQAMAELQGAHCPGCKRRKKEMQSFCKSCFSSLPLEIRKGLYLSFAAGYVPFYRKAKELLCA